MTQFLGFNTNSQGKLHATAQYDKRTKHLVHRLRPGEVAIIDHTDLDGLAAQTLVQCRPSAVINLGSSISGLYPNTGPTILLSAGITLYECTQRELLDYVQKPTPVDITAESKLKIAGTDTEFVLQKMTEKIVDEQLAAAREHLTDEMVKFASNTLEYLQKEAGPLLDPLHLPGVKTVMRDRHVVVVVRGARFEDDLEAISGYMRDVKPVIIAVDGAADALITQGFKPHIILGDMDSVSDAALRSGAELLAHQYANSNRISPALQRMQDQNLPHIVWRFLGTSEDLALLLAYELGAKLIVTVGSHFSMIEFLEKGRMGMSSTFLTRLRVGDRLVDAKGVSRLWTSRLPRTEISLLIISALIPIIAAFCLSPSGKHIINLIQMWLKLKLNL